MNIPFLNLAAHHAPLRKEISAVIEEVIDSGAFAGGPFVCEFEDAFAEYCECRHAMGVASGTDALWLSLLALGVGPGDEVITVPNTFMGTAEAISYCGARPVFVDVDELTYTMDPAALAAAITPRTRAVIPVHLFGQAANMDSINAIVSAHHLPVIEDACQAHGALYKGRKVGALATAGCFSFYPGKNLGAFGEGGAVVTNDAALAERIRVLRDHGQVQKYHHTMVGWNSRMDGIQAAVLQVKLRHLDRGNQHRRSRAAEYNHAFAGQEGVTTPFEAEANRHVYHIYALRLEQRSEVMNALEARGIGYGIHYPVPIHLQEAYRGLGCRKGAFPVAERCAEELLSLPMYPELTSSHAEAVAETVKEALATGVTA